MLVVIRGQAVEGWEGVCVMGVTYRRLRENDRKGQVVELVGSTEEKMGWLDRHLPVMRYEHQMGGKSALVRE